MLFLMNIAKGRKGLERCGVWAEDCSIHHKPHPKVVPLNRLLLQGAYLLFLIYHLYLCVLTGRVYSKLTGLSGSWPRTVGVAASELLILYTLFFPDVKELVLVSKKERLVKQNSRICHGSVYCSLWTLFLDVKEKRDGKNTSLFYNYIVWRCCSSTQHCHMCGFDRCHNYTLPVTCSGNGCN